MIGILLIHRRATMQSFWQHHDIGHYGPLKGQEECDIAIVGGGYTCCWLAYWLKDNGLKTVVLEQKQPGWGASGRNGGLLLQGGAQMLATASTVMGKAAALQLWHTTRQSFEYVLELNKRYALDYAPTGSLYVGGDAGEQRIIEETVALMNEAGIPARVVPKKEQPASIQRLGYDLGAWFPDDGMVHPLKLIAALLNEATKMGIRVYGNSEVKEADWSGDRVTLTGANFSVRAQKVIVATNAYVPAWLPTLQNAIHPVRGQILATIPISPMDHAYPVYADHGYNYWHQRPDGRLMAGGFRHLDLTEEVGTELVLHDAIQERLTQLVKDLTGSSAPISDRWAGIMGMTHDHLPYVGMLNPKVGVALGYSGHGSTVTPIVAKMLHDAIIDNAPVFAPFSLSRLDAVSKPKSQ